MVKRDQARRTQRDLPRIFLTWQLTSQWMTQDRKDIDGEAADDE
jgi:hypothetical protein